MSSYRQIWLIRLALLALQLVLFSILAYLHETGALDWSWWIVTIPLYAPLAAVFGLLLLAYILHVLPTPEPDGTNY